MTLQALNTILIACTLHINPRTPHQNQQVMEMERECRASIIACVDTKEIKRNKSCMDNADSNCKDDEGQRRASDEDTVSCIASKIVHGR
jgi:hypothetical protein